MFPYGYGYGFHPAMFMMAQQQLHVRYVCRFCGAEMASATDTSGNHDSSCPRSSYRSTSSVSYGSSYQSSNNSYNSSVTVEQYHGTSVSAAQSILSSGFQQSSSGQLGRGVYLAREDKAERFARDRGGSGGVVLRCQFTASNPKYVSNSSRAGNWAAEGHDAVRADDTAMSTNMEWCCQCHVTVLAWRYVHSSTWNSTSSRP